MNEICAIVDIQGFNFKDRFVARELAICSDVITQCQELNPKIYWRSLTPEEQELIKHTTKFVNGLYYAPFNPVEHAFLPHSDDVGVLLKSYYDLIASPEKPKFAFKNQFLKPILEKENIPYIDLDDLQYNIPSINTIENIFGNNYACGYHKKPPRDGSNIAYRCAYRKTNHLWRYLKNKENTEQRL
jgi:hypothetical protein